MKNTLTLFILALSLVSCKQQTTTTDSTMQKDTVSKEVNLVGGWSTADVTPVIKELAAFVLSEKNISSPVQEISNVSSQVVSGKNYKFDMALEDGSQYKTQIYVNLQGEKEITNFEKLPEE